MWKIGFNRFPSKPKKSVIRKAWYTWRPDKIDPIYRKPSFLHERVERGGAEPNARCKRNVGKI